MNTLTSLMPLMLALPIYSAASCEPEPNETDDWDMDGVPADLDCDDHSDRIGLTDWTVGGPEAQFADIQSAVLAASPGDSICVAAGVYDAPVHIDKPLTLWAGDRGDETIINGTRAERAVTIVDAPDSVLTGFIIRGASVPDGDPLTAAGAGVLVLRSDRTWIADNYIHGNAVQTDDLDDGEPEGLGGGLAVLESESVQITGNRFVDNQARYGGGIGVGQGSHGIGMSNNEIVANRAEWEGGGLYASGMPNSTLAANVFEGNRAGAGAGGALLMGFDNSWLQENTFSDNLAEADVGGLALILSSDASLEGNHFLNNQSGAEGYGVGGGLYLENCQDIRITGGEIAGNRAHFGGGAMLYHASGITFQSLTIEGNNAGEDEWGGLGSGGGIFGAEVGHVDLNDIRFAQNTAGHGGAVKIAGSCDDQSTYVTVREGVFESNTAMASGGGMDVDCIRLFTLEDNTVFTGNQAGDWGGGVFTDRVTEMAIIGGAFTGNQAELGGGVKLDASGVNIIRGTQFTNNRGESDGGGLQVLGGGDLEVSDVSFVGNHAGNQGGGLALWDVAGTSLIQRSTFDFNNSDHMGAGMHLGNSASATVAESIFEGNQSVEGGAGLTCFHEQDTGWFTIDGSEFVDNSPTDTACTGCGSNGDYCE